MSKCLNCGCDSNKHVKHSSTGLRPCNAFRVRDKEPGEVENFKLLHTDEDGNTWRPCHCGNYQSADDVIEIKERRVAVSLTGLNLDL